VKLETQLKNCEILSTWQFKEDKQIPIEISQSFYFLLYNHDRKQRVSIVLNWMNKKENYTHNPFKETLFILSVVSLNLKFLIPESNIHWIFVTFLIYSFTSMRKEDKANVNLILVAILCDTERKAHIQGFVRRWCLKNVIYHPTPHSKPHEVVQGWNDVQDFEEWDLKLYDGTKNGRKRSWCKPM